MKYAFFILIFCSCSKMPQFKVTEKYVYNKNGFTEGFSIQSIIVSKLENGLPSNYQNDSERADLNYSVSSPYFWATQN